MTSLTIRKLELALKERLRVRAAHHGHSMEAEARNILKDALSELGGLELEEPARDWLEAGDSVEITRQGMRVARLTSVTGPRKRIDRSALQALTATMAPAAQSAADLVRDMRDSDRY